MTLPNFDYSSPNGGFTPRYVKNAFGVDESIMLSVSHWKHFDWLVSIEENMDKATQNCDISRHIGEEFHVKFSGSVEKMLIRDEAKCHRVGEDVPLFINPHRIVD